jgi:hypothetical protein
LQAGVQQHLFLHDRFVCLTDQRLPGVECIPLERKGVIGWWNKLELFRRGLFSGQVAYFDLDTMIIRDVCDMFSTPRAFASLTSWNRPELLASGVMTWTASDALAPIFEDFSPKDIDRYLRKERWGDQGWIQDKLTTFESLNELYPERIVSYKYHVRKQSKVPGNASVVAFHGSPRPADIGWKLDGFN